MAYDKMLVDEIGRTYERKNRYIIDLLNASPEEAKSIRSNKATHPYNVELADFHSREKVFKRELAEQLKIKSTENFRSKELGRLNMKLFEAQRKSEFYEQYRELTYDAVLEYDCSAHIVKVLPKLIEEQEQIMERIDNLNSELANISTDSDIQGEIERRGKICKEVLDKSYADLKEKYNEGLISKKAYVAEKKKSLRAYKEDMTAIGYLDRKTSINEELKSVKHRLKTSLETGIRVIESDISDIRRKTPVETEREYNLKSYFTIPFPGLGQLLNGQYVKAALFALTSLFIYLIAIPYALGFGNYQGEGIAGLISLADGGHKLDKSIIFMIEGVIAIILLLFAIFALYSSFKDVYRVENGVRKGIRPYSWFETKQRIEREGFPYLISAPAYVIVIFIVIIPIITTFLISFTNLDPSHQSKFTWVGIENYRLVALGEGLAGKTFWLVLGWTFIWTFGATTLAIAIGFILSLIVNQERVIGKRLFRTIYLLPWAVPAFITIMFFSLMVAKGGPITTLIENVFGLSLDIKNQPHLTRIALILLQGWLGSAYIFLLSTGVLQGIPSDLYEAAEIDGATGFQRTLRITIPLVLFQTAPLLIGQYTFNFNNFSIIYLFNQGGPFNPSLYGNLAGASDLLISYIYKLTIENQYQAIGAVITAIISLLLIFVTFLGFKRTKAFKED